MDYLILAEITAIGGYLFWLGRKVIELGQKINNVVPGPESRFSTPTPIPEGNQVKIIRFSNEGYSIIANCHESHENVGLALSTPELGVLHPDGTIQRTAGEGK